MESQYGIAVKNKYSLFLEEGDDIFDILSQDSANSKKKDEATKTKKDGKADKTAKSKSKQAKKVVASPAVEQKPKGVDQNANKKDEKPMRTKSRQDREFGDKPNKENRPSGGFGAPARDRRDNREGGFDRDSRFQKERTDKPFGGQQSEFRDRGEGRGRGGRGRGRGGGGRGRGGYDRKREFERHSGSDKTGIKAVDKRDGSGSHNWGTVKDGLEEQLNETAVSDEQDWADDKPADTEGKTQGDNPDQPTDALDEDAEKQKEEQEKQMTLDEWKQMQMQDKVQASFNIRRAGEGCDESQWKKMHVLKKKEQEESDEEATDDEEEEDPRRAKAKQQVTINIEFSDSRRGNRGGGRGRGRGDMRFRDGDRRDFQGGNFSRRSEGGRGGARSYGRGRGGGSNRGGRDKDVDLHIEDENDFPALVKTEAS